MDKTNLINSKDDNNKEVKSSKGSNESQEQYRIVITKEANECLEVVAAKVNKGFEAGTVNRSDVAIYVFQNLSKLLTESDIKAMRSLHFDEKKVLGSILKSDEDLPEEIRRVLREHYGVNDKEKKRSVRSAQELSTERGVDNSSVAS